MSLLETLQQRTERGLKSIAVLIDPDKVQSPADVEYLVHIAQENYVDFFFIGGSLITTNNLGEVIHTIKAQSKIPVVLFPGSNMHIDFSADAILFLSLISGRNPELLIGQHVVAAPLLRHSKLEILPTGYLLVSNDHHSAASYMSNTTPIPSDKYSVAASTALAGEMLGLRLIYMDAGSGAKQPISPKMIATVKRAIKCPLIIGGGINTVDKAAQALEAGADVIVIGNAFEKDPNLLTEVSGKVYEFNKPLNIY
jgi:phosphoglycerol geranylgeranyltransferase